MSNDSHVNKLIRQVLLYDKQLIKKARTTILITNTVKAHLDRLSNEWGLNPSIIARYALHLGLKAIEKELNQ